MAKIEWVFQDESGTNLNRYIATNVNTGEKITFDLLRGGNVSIVGTPLNASNLNSLITAINNNYDEIATLKTSVSTNSSKIALLETDNTNNKNTISALGRGLTNAESRISTNATNIQTNATGISKNASDISQLQIDVASQGQAINDNKSIIGNINDRVVTLEEEIQVANDSINANTDEINNLKDNINTISKTIFEVTLKVANLGDTSGTLKYDNSTSSIISSMGTNSQNYEIKFKYVISSGKTLIYYLSYSDFVNAGGYSQYIYSNGYHKITIIPAVKGCIYSVYQAKYATYASTDTSKGTIEERLSNLGFKTGVFTVSAKGSFGSLNPSDLNITLNSIRKKGKYCIGNFTIEQRTEGKYYGSIKTLTLTIPEDFKPAVGLGFYAKASIIQNTLDGKIVSPVDDTIWVTSTSNDTTTININAQVTDTSLYRDPSIESVMFLSIGWETA